MIVISSPGWVQPSAESLFKLRVNSGGLIGSYSETIRIGFRREQWRFPREPTLARSGGRFGVVNVIALFSPAINSRRIRR